MINNKTKHFYGMHAGTVYSWKRLKDSNDKKPLRRALAYAIDLLSIEQLDILADGAKSIPVYAVIDNSGKLLFASVSKEDTESFMKLVNKEGIQAVQVDNTSITPLNEVKEGYDE